MYLYLYRTAGLLVAIVCLMVVGCSSPDQLGQGTKNVAESTNSDSATVPSSTGEDQTGSVEVESEEDSAVHNLLHVGKQIYSGGEPHDDNAFAELANMGVKTVVSVDGATPDIETARKYGLRYVHIPIGYDGVDQEAGLLLAKLVREADGPFFIHCHHGRHRGPAAAAIACIAAGDTDNQGAIGILERAGTNKGYAGLWRDVGEYRIPAADATIPDLVEIAEVDSFSAAMAKIDRAYDNLKLCRDAQWAAPSDHPDLVPAQEALLLKEGLRESARNLVEGYDAQMKTWLTESEALARELETTLESGGPPGKVERQFQGLEDSCKQCHQKFRN